MPNKINWKFVYHLANVILIPLFGIIPLTRIIPITFDSQVEVFLNEALWTSLIVECAWVFISGIINQSVRAYWGECFEQFLSCGCVTFLSLFVFGLGIIASICFLTIVIPSILLTCLIVPFSISAVYLFVSSAILLILKDY